MGHNALKKFLKHVSYFDFHDSVLEMFCFRGPADQF